MRVIHFISSPAAGGAETYVRDLSVIMSKKGHDIHIVFLQTAAEGGRDLEFEKDFLKSLSDSNITYSFIGKVSRKKPWLGGFRLRKIIKSFKPDLLHCHLYYALLFSFFSFGVPVVYTHHNIKLGLPKFFYRIFDFKVSSYVGICSACENMLGRRKRDVLQINNAVCGDRVYQKLKINDHSSSKIFCIFIGSLCEQKNLTLMLKAIEQINNPNVYLQVAGEGPDKEKLMNLVTELNIGKQVYFLGNVTNIASVLEESDIFLMSSKWEGLPISLIEATLTGLPVVVTNVGGSAEVVHECAHGFVVDSFEVSDYASALKKLVDNAELRAFFSRNALAFSSVYEVECSVNKHIELYRKCSLVK